MLHRDSGITDTIVNIGGNSSVVYIMGLTKRTLFGIVLFKLNILFFHVFLRSLVLILPVHGYVGFIGD